jgi:hypothetical protein
MKYIITEEQNLRLRLLRRISVIDEMIVPSCERVLRWGYDICRHDVNSYVSSVASNIVEDMYYEYFSDIEDDSDEWYRLSEMMKNYVQNHYRTIEKFYKKRCND